MKTPGQVFTRALDAALLVCLVLGNSDVKEFAFWLISFMVALTFMGWFVMTPDLAEKIQGRTLLKKAFGVLVPLLFVAALIYGGFPILAALYATAASGVRIAAESKLAAQVKP
ncbi:hypothetical protein ICY20_18035 [Pseudomonas sp. P115]|uniref:hypothetical protein n=1 Tax=Pseudomonas pisciculturae TaxID=2730413 RepID=UPI0018921A80|nr:hypothetical protein [Pseudomonas pisciculturae]MBF6029652.1 hypothetical protein [Pseudomonas pisciculturae]